MAVSRAAVDYGEQLKMKVQPTKFCAISVINVQLWCKHLNWPTRKEFLFCSKVQSGIPTA